MLLCHYIVTQSDDINQNTFHNVVLLMPKLNLKLHAVASLLHIHK